MGRRKHLWAVLSHRKEAGSWPLASSRRGKAIMVRPAEWAVSLQSQWVPAPPLASSFPWANHPEVGQQLTQSFLSLLQYLRLP